MNFPASKMRPVDIFSDVHTVCNCAVASLGYASIMGQLVSHLNTLYADVGLDLKQLDMDPLPCLCCPCLHYERQQLFMLTFLV